MVVGYNSYIHRRGARGGEGAKLAELEIKRTIIALKLLRDITYTSYNTVNPNLSYK